LLYPDNYLGGIMGVCLVAQTLDDTKIQAIIANPPLVWRIVAPEDPLCYLKEIGQAQAPGFFSRLFGKQRAYPAEIPEFIFGAAENKVLDMDKSWDGVNFCLNRLIPKDECPNFFEAGRKIGKVEIGYGPAQCFMSGEVSKIATQYGQIADTELLAAYQSSHMGKTYPHGFWTRDTADCRDYLKEHFAALKAFLSDAQAHQLGILIQYT
jgi:hypothetical protein